jgi:hypothetical protein
VIVCWLLRLMMLCWYLRLVLTVINSPIFIAILSLSLGSFVAQKLSSRYQRKQQIFDLRIQGLKTLLDAHAKWLHTHLTGQRRESHEDWMQFITTERYARVLFPGSEAEQVFKTYFDAAAELNKYFGMPVGAAAQSDQDNAIEGFQRALNGLMRVLVARLGISEKD